VKECIHEESGLEYAVKILGKMKILKEGMSRRLRQEIYIIQNLEHRNIVKFQQVLSSKTKLYIVMELVRGIDLETYVAKSGKIEESNARFIFQQLVSAVVYCHRKGVVHRDLKAQNILLTENNTLKLIDFGVSSICSANRETPERQLLHTSCGSPFYCAPEVLSVSESGYSGEKADSWSCGVILFYMLSGELPFVDEQIDALIELMTNASPAFNERFDSDAMDLVSRLLQPVAENRASISQIINHPWLTKSEVQDVLDLNQHEIQKLSLGVMSDVLSESSNKSKLKRESHNTELQPIDPTARSPHEQTLSPPKS